MELIDEIIKVKDKEAIEMTRQLAWKEGLSIGISSEAATLAVPKVAVRVESESKLLVVVLPDTGERARAQHSLVPSRIGVTNHEK